MRKRILLLLQYGISIILLSIGIICTYIDYSTFKNHPEWSAPAYVVYWKLFLGILLSVINFLLIGFIKQRRK